MLISTKGSFWLFNPTSAYVFAGVAAVAFVIYCGYSLVILKYFPQRYRGIRFNTQTIAYIGVMSGTSAAATIVVSFYFPITVLPQFRLAFELLMIRICAILLGPVAGVLSATITEIIVLFFIPSYVHIAFFLTAITVALIAGLVSVTCPNQHRQRMWYLLGLTTVVIGFAVLVLFYTNKFGQVYHRIEILNGISLSVGTAQWLMGAVFGFLLLLLWGTEFVSSVAKTKKLDGALLMKVIIITIITEFVVNTFLMSWGENSLLSKRGYNFLVVYHLLQAPFQTVLYVPITYTTVLVVRPLLKMRCANSMPQPNVVT